MTERRLLLEDEPVYGVAWGNRDLLYTIHGPLDAPRSEVITVPVEGSGYSSLRTKPNPACRMTEYLRPQVVRGGIGFYQDCRALTPGAAQLVLFDEETGEFTPLTTGEFPFNPSQFSFDPSLRLGVFSYSSDICAGIAWISGGEIEYRDITLSVGGREYRLDRDLIEEEGCSGLRASAPDWSPDGRQIAFLASPESIGLRDFRRAEAPWNVYVMDPVGTGIQEVFSGVLDAHDLWWSPDGERLVFSGEVEGQGPGVWILDPLTRELTRVWPDKAQAVSWSPDGSAIALVAPGDDPTGVKDDLWIVSVP